jgi:inhibitor of KinA
MAGAEVSPTLGWAGERSLRVAVGEGISEATRRRVLGAYRRLRAAGIPGLLDVTPAFATLLLTFDAGSLDPAQAEDRVARALEGLGAGEEASGRSVEIPVCYEGDLAPDLDDVARLHDLSPGEAAGLHASADYVVHFLGFSPGFPYLGGLPERLATPRLERPRVRVPPGSVGIAGQQTGVYPNATPGGWRLVGRTPLRLFAPERDPPALLALGDHVRFVPISRAQFDRLLVQEA